MHAVGAHAVHRTGELLESRVIVGPAGLLEQMDGLGVEQVLFLAAAELVGTAVGQLHVDVQTQRVKGCIVQGLHIGLNVLNGNAAHTAHEAVQGRCHELRRTEQ